jgi:hypothetical protein
MEARPPGPEPQTANAVLLVEPAGFAFNPETARSNSFARAGEGGGRARAEFDGLAKRLEEAGVDVVVLADSAGVPRPDAIFPNNWVSFHADGTLVTYPMAAPSRRLERRTEALMSLLEAKGFHVARHVDLAGHEIEGRFLEATGSLVLDRPRREAYACLSERTHPAVIAEFDARLGFATFAFSAADPAGRAIYHSNVMMSLGTRFALVCLACVAPADRHRLADRIEASGRTLIDVGWNQLTAFACNLLELRDGAGRPLVALSSRAKASLRPGQRRRLESLAGELIDTPVPTIEAVGGGGVRCMIAELHLPRTGTAVGR